MKNRLRAQQKIPFVSEATSSRFDGFAMTFGEIVTRRTNKKWGRKKSSKVVSGFRAAAEQLSIAQCATAAHLMRNRSTKKTVNYDVHLTRSPLAGTQQHDERNPKVTFIHLNFINFFSLSLSLASSPMSTSQSSERNDEKKGKKRPVREVVNRASSLSMQWRSNLFSLWAARTWNTRQKKLHICMLINNPENE